MDKILSIAVPAYNVSKYLEKCLDSLKVESILDKLEIIVVDDGSKDNTAEIAQRYHAKYPESYFVYSKENGGHGSGINFGIAHATGKYFKVVDGDDWLNTEKLEEFLAVLEQQEADIVASDFLCIQDETEAILDQKYCTENAADYGQTRYMSRGEIQNVIKMHSLTIKTEILKNMGRRIDEHCFYVDCEYIAYPIPWVESVYYCNQFIYMYRLGRDGQSMNIKSMQKNRTQHMRVLQSLLRFYDETENLSVHVRRYIEKCIGQVVENQFQIYISMGLQPHIRKELQEWDTDLKNNYPKVYASTNKKSITWLRCTNYLILGIGALVYKIVK